MTTITEKELTLKKPISSRYGHNIPKGTKVLVQIDSNGHVSVQFPGKTNLYIGLGTPTPEKFRQQFEEIDNSKIDIKAGDEFWFLSLHTNQVWKSKAIKVNKLNVIFEEYPKFKGSKFPVSIDLFDYSEGKLIRCFETQTNVKTEDGAIIEDNITPFKTEKEAVTELLNGINISKNTKLKEIEQVTTIFQKKMDALSDIEKLEAKTKEKLLKLEEV